MIKDDNAEITILIDEQARDSDSLLDAFSELFVSISESMPTDELVKKILRLRRARTVFERSRQRLSLVDNKIVKGHLYSIALSKKVFNNRRM